MLNAYCLNVLKLLLIFPQSENSIYKTVFCDVLNTFLKTVLLNIKHKHCLQKTENISKLPGKAASTLFQHWIIPTVVNLSHYYDVFFCFIIQVLSYSFYP